MNFLEQITKRAKKNKKTIVLPESTDKRILKAASMVTKQEIANIILVGEKEKIYELSDGIDLSNVKILNPKTFDKINEFAEKFYEMRKHKKITKEEAEKTVLNPLYFAVMLVKMGIADGMVAGAINSTSNTLRPALQILKTKKGTKIVSAFFIMAVPDCKYGENGTFLYADSGLVENPDADTLSEIALSSAKSFKQLVEKEPIVGMLSYSTYGSADSELTQKVVKATKLAKEKNSSLKLDGELQVDAAIVPEIGKSKAKGSKIAGKCNTLVFPDLNSGNIAYKLTQRLAKAQAYGPITQGIAMPVNDLSRGCSTDDILGVVAITCVQSQTNN